MQEKRITFTAVVVSHRNPIGLAKILGNLMYQTVPPDEFIILVSGYSWAEIGKLVEHFGHLGKWCVEEDYQDWGHDKRRRGLELANSDWVGFFNDDDSYEMDYIEKMMHAASRFPETRVVYCGWNDQPHCSFRAGSSTSGNFIVATELAQHIGWPYSGYESDGVFIDSVARHAHPVKVGEVLYHHNHQP